MSAQRYCDNCNSVLHGEFCHHCGQEKKSYIRNVSGVVTEFFGEFSNWDTRLWRTLIPLWFRPGFLSRRYVSGHRVPYVPPLRLYLFTSIIAFLIFAKLMPQQAIEVSAVASDPELIVLETKDGADITLAELLKQTQTELQQVPGLPNNSAVPIYINDEHSQHTLALPFISEQAQQRLNERFAAVVANPKLAVNKFFSLAPQMMFLLLPLFALLLKLLYVRSDRYYMEHLIVALHSHSFILQFSVLYLALGLLRQSISWSWLATVVGWLETAVLCWIPLYLLLCQKFYYRQRWGKTLLKFWLTSSVYNLLFISAVIGLIVLSILWA
ncbi:Zn-ribbon domain-containing protein [Arsukibacterium ikkense]|uniref:Zn-ribbon domain-containing protein n=2 Tax=Arsukibacterium ikkense TaxID=336831 RepID=A0A0M2VAG9_9GAMM|nr:Zn-ribbon domain-containing protein [Arsukibacterium ikkense]